MYLLAKPTNLFLDPLIHIYAIQFLLVFIAAQPFCADISIFFQFFFCSSFLRICKIVHITTRMYTYISPNTYNKYAYIGNRSWLREYAFSITDFFSFYIKYQIVRTIYIEQFGWHKRSCSDTINIFTCTHVYIRYNVQYHHNLYRKCEQIQNRNEEEDPNIVYKIQFMYRVDLLYNREGVQ